MTRSRCFTTALMLLLVVLSASAQILSSQADAVGGERRVALVIGNAAYPAGRLNNPLLDARAIASALRSVGFDVLAHEDVTYRGMRRAVAAFGEQMSGGEVALFYYAGHGLQVSGKNYLVPVDAEIKSENYVAAETVELDSVLARMHEAKTRVNIVILDACRDNPFARRFRSPSRGLAFMDAPAGTYVAYATAPGSVAEDGEPGKNGVYTSELLKVLHEPGLKLEDVFKRVRAGVLMRTNQRQNPWDASSLTGDFFFVRTTSPQRPENRVVHWTWDDRRIPGPPTVKITMPRDDVPAELAAFVGVWEGAWDGILESRLVVESVEGLFASVVYGWADHPRGRFKGGWSEYRARMSPDAKLSWGSEALFTFEMRRDLKSLDGRFVHAGGVSVVRMTRLGP